MVLVMVSMSGICEPRIAKPKAKGLVVPSIKVISKKDYTHLHPSNQHTVAFLWV